MKRTKVDAELEAAEAQFADDPERAELIHRARRFKSSWLELAEALTSARKTGAWKRWGHASFEEYARVELHLRQETVEKLTGSFAFLQRRAPEVLARDGVRASIPSYQAVDLLRRAEERAEEKEGAPREAVVELRKRVLEDGAQLTSIARPLRDAALPPTDAERRERDFAAVKNVATRLKELLGETRAVPRGLASEVKGALEKLLASIGEREEAA